MLLRRTWPLVLWGFFSLSPLTVLAQAAPPPAPAAPPSPGYAPGWYPPPPGYAPAYYPPPPVLPRPEVGVRRHDGFYLRMGTGVAYGHVRGSGQVSSLLGEGGGDTTVTYKGWGPAYELLVGGTVARGFVLGGGFAGQDISDPKLTVKSDSTSDSEVAHGSLGVGVLGAFIDWFPNEEKGLHFGTMMGMALLGVPGGSSGFAGSLFGGHDFWIASQWSLGVQGRVVALRSTQSLPLSSGTLHDTAISAELLLTALYH